MEQERVQRFAERIWEAIDDFCDVPPDDQPWTCLVAGVLDTIKFDVQNGRSKRIKSVIQRRRGVSGDQFAQ